MSATTGTATAKADTGLLLFGGQLRRGRTGSGFLWLVGRVDGAHGGSRGPSSDLPCHGVFMIELPGMLLAWVRRNCRQLVSVYRTVPVGSGGS